MPYVGIYIHPWHTYGHDILRGISRFMARHTDWECYLPWPGSTSEAQLPAEKLDGIIMRVGGQFDVPAAFGATIPRVVIANTDELSTPVDISWDNHAIGRLAGEHLMEQGHRTMIAVGYFAASAYQRQRADGLAAAVGARGIKVRRIDLGTTDTAALRTLLTKLLRPAAVFAVTDPIGGELLHVVRQLGRRVPEDIAIVAAGDNDVFCEMTSPPLSSVALPGAEVGVLAAAKLHALLSRRPPPPVNIVPPRYITTRRSTELLAIDDVLVAQALRSIRAGACHGMTVADVRAQVPLSRRALEIRFKKRIGRTIEQEIQRVQLERTKRLLLDTDLTIHEIADRSGFSSPQRLSAVFARLEHESPSAYRHRARDAQSVFGKGWAAIDSDFISSGS